IHSTGRACRIGPGHSVLWPSSSYRTNTPAQGRATSCTSGGTTGVRRNAGRIADEVTAHLTGLMGSQVTVTLAWRPRSPGVPDAVVRTVTENSRTLKFVSHGFEAE